MMPRFAITERLTLQRAILHWGREAQLEQAVEEMAETIVAIQHHKRGRDDDGLVEEAADLCVMAEQLRIMAGDAAVDEKIHEKMDRLRHRLDEEQGD